MHRAAASPLATAARGLRRSGVAVEAALKRVERLALTRVELALSVRAVVVRADAAQGEEAVVPRP